MPRLEAALHVLRTPAADPPPAAPETKLDKLDRWLRESRPALVEAARRRHVREPFIVSVLRCLVLASRDDLTSETYAQLAEKTHLSPDQVEKAVKALVDLGMLHTVRKAASPGRGGKGQAGRPPLRMLLWPALSVDIPINTPRDPDKDPASGRVPPRSITTEKNPSGFHFLTTPDSLDEQSGGEGKELEHLDMLAVFAFEMAWHLLGKQATGTVRDPHAWTTDQQKRILDALNTPSWNTELVKIRALTPGSPEWKRRLGVLASELRTAPEPEPSEPIRWRQEETPRATPGRLEVVTATPPNADTPTHAPNTDRNSPDLTTSVVEHVYADARNRSQIRSPKAWKAEKARQVEKKLAELCDSADDATSERWCDVRIYTEHPRHRSSVLRPAVQVLACLVEGETPNPATSDALTATLEAANRLESLHTALCWALGPPGTATEDGDYWRTVKELAEVGATREDVAERVNMYRMRWPEVICTANALRKHWSKLEKPRPFDYGF